MRLQYLWWVVLGCIVAVAVPEGCGRPAMGRHVRDLWGDVAYDRPLTIDQLREGGWTCRNRSTPTADGIDGECGPVRTSGITLFGVPVAVATVFLKEGYSHSVNLQLHGTTATYVADNLVRVLGAPAKSTFTDGECTLLWRNERGYMMSMHDGDPSKFVTLFVSPRAEALGELLPNDPWAAFKAKVFRQPCSTY
jgi:hypothetical protein